MREAAHRSSGMRGAGNDGRLAGHCESAMRWHKMLNFKSPAIRSRVPHMLQNVRKTIISCVCGREDAGCRLYASSAPGRPASRARRPKLETRFQQLECLWNVCTDVPITLEASCRLPGMRGAENRGSVSRALQNCNEIAPNVDFQTSSNRVLQLTNVEKCSNEHCELCSREGGRGMRAVCEFCLRRTRIPSPPSRTQNTSPPAGISVECLYVHT